MEHYELTRIENEPTSRADVPFTGLPESVWLVTTSFSDTTGKLLKKCARAIEKTGAVVLFEEAEGISKVVLLADLLLERHPWLHKYVKTDTRDVEEYWEPKMPELSTLKVVRQRPRIFIVLSSTALESEPTTQHAFDFLDMTATEKTLRSHRNFRGMSVSKEEFEAASAEKATKSNKAVESSNRRNRNQQLRRSNRGDGGDAPERNRRRRPNNNHQEQQRGEDRAHSAGNKIRSDG